MIKLVEFSPEHFWQITNLQHEQLAIATIVEDKYLERLQEAGPAYTYMDGNVVIACFGVADMWSGVGEAWMFVSNLVQQKPVSAIKVARWFCGILDERYHRVQTTVESDFEKGRNFLKNIGFIFEGRMWKYGPNKKDYDRYARIGA